MKSNKENSGHSSQYELRLAVFVATIDPRVANALTEAVQRVSDDYSVEIEIELKARKDGTKTADKRGLQHQV